MKLSLSARIAEHEHRKDSTAISFEELAILAKETGYAGLCIRPSQATVDTPKETIQEMREVMDRHGLVPSMVTLDQVIATNTDEAGRPQREIDRHLAARGIFAWSGNFYALPLSEALDLEPGGAVRVGLLHYNTAAEVDLLVEALEELVGG